MSFVLNLAAAKRYEKEYDERLQRYFVKQGMVPSPDSSADEKDGFPPGLSPRVVRAWFDQGLDLAANSPAAVLTLFAFSELPGFDSDIPHVLLVFMGLALVLGLRFVDAPNAAGAYRRWTKFNVSLLTMALFVLNAGGLIYSIYL
ncbi:hypothetical protein [Kineococcus glutinatus]|uniref:hypothetical protein n=1 Tax=Kineococcus glutinatus TaxID=1070872 RepID=UPI0031E9981A